MDRVKMSVKQRPIKTKGYLNKLREDGFIPGVVYGKDIEGAIPVMFSYPEFVKFLHHHHWENTIIDMTIESEDGNKDYTVIIQEISHDPVMDRINHVDFHQISMTEAVHVRVPVKAKGEPVGVKKGGVLEHMVWEIDIECLPTDIPDAIVVDVSGLDIGDSIHVSDIEPPEGVRILEAGDTAVFLVEYAGGGQAETSGEQAEGQEPEVIEKGSKKESE